MPEAKEYLTQEKFDELTKELEYLRKVRRKEVAEALEYAKSLGDLSENAEYHEARETQAGIEDRIAKLETVLKTAEIVEHHKSDTVQVGSRVTIQREGEKKNMEFEIVGSEEADASQGKLSFHSPIGAALKGKRKGDSFVVVSPKGKMTYKILGIE
jgi:transcription elongation factor GreA